MLSRSVPVPSSLAEGFVATARLLRVQWSGMGTKVRILAVSIFLFVMLGLFAISHIGDLLKIVAMDSSGVAQEYAMKYLRDFTQGGLGTFGSIALGAAAFSAVLAPFTGVASTSLVPPKDLAGLSMTRWHRFSDSLVVQAFSSLSLLQLLTLTALTSLLTIEGDRTSALVVTGVTWLCLVALSVASLWVAEFLHRRFGALSKALTLLPIALTLSAAAWLDADHGTTLFGLGTKYALLIQGVGEYSNAAQFIAVTTILFVAFGLLCVAVMCAAIALGKPERTARRLSAKVYSGRFAIRGDGLYAIFLRNITRLPEVRKPIISVVAVGLALAVFSQPGAVEIISGFAIILPSLIALAWGSNAFAHLGGGATWLASQPEVFKNAAWTLFLTQIGISVTLFLVIWTPFFVLQKATLGDFVGNLLAILATGVIVARSATQKSLKQPSGSHFGTRGESTLSPSRALNYTLRFALWGGAYGLIVLSVEGNLVQLGLCAAAVIWQLVRMVKLQEYWQVRESRSTIVAAVAND